MADERKQELNLDELEEVSGGSVFSQGLNVRKETQDDSDEALTLRDSASNVGAAGLGGWGVKYNN